MSKAQKEHMSLMEHMEYLHENAPHPFNRDYNPNYSTISNRVVSKMESDGIYERFTRSDCSKIYRFLYDSYKRRMIWISTEG